MFFSVVFVVEHGGLDEARWYSRQGLHLHCRRSRRRASGCWATRAKERKVSGRARRTCTPNRRAAARFDPASNGSRFAGPVHAPKERKLAPGRTCTGPGPGLSRLPLRWVTGVESREWSHRQDLHPHWRGSEPRASAVGLRRVERKFASCRCRPGVSALEARRPGCWTNDASSFHARSPFREKPGRGRCFRFQRSSPWPHCPERQRKRVGRLTGYAPVPRRSQCRVLLLHYSLRVGCEDGAAPRYRPGKNSGFADRGVHLLARVAY